MKYLFLPAQLFELFLAATIFTGGEFPETIASGVVLLVSSFFLICYAGVYSEHKTIIKYAAYVNSAALLSGLAWALYQGPEYFYWNWKGMQVSEYHWLLALVFVAFILQLLKLATSNVITKRFVIIFSLGVAIPAVLALLPEYSMRMAGNDVVRKVEEFRKEQGRLPNSRAELGLEDSETSHPYYTRKNEDDYELFYPSGFDEGYIYRSYENRWGSHP